MTDLRQALTDYLAMRRAMGSRLARAEKLLAQFLTYLEERGQTRLRIVERCCLGDRTDRRGSELVGTSPGRGPRLRDLSAHDRPGD